MGEGGRKWDIVRNVENRAKLLTKKAKYQHTISTWSQSAPSFMVFEHAAPNAAKSALRIDGAMMAGGDILASVCVLVAYAGLYFSKASVHQRSRIRIDKRLRNEISR